VLMSALTIKASAFFAIANLRFGGTHRKPSFPLTSLGNTS